MGTQKKPRLVVDPGADRAVVPWLSERMLILEVAGKRGAWAGIVFLAAGAAGIVFSYMSIIHLIAWACHIANGTKNAAQRLALRFRNKLTLKERGESEAS